MKRHEAELREKLEIGRTALIKHLDGTYEVRGSVELGTRFPGDEVIYIFANVEDLDQFFQFFGDS